MLCDDLDELDGKSGGEAQEGGGICIPIADSHCCTAEIHTRHSKAIILQLQK